MRAVLVLLMQNGMTDIWPELFYDVKYRTERQLLDPPLAGLGPGAIRVGVIQARGCGRCTIADNFGIVRCRAAAVRPGNDQAAERISGALQETTASQGEITRVCPEDDRKREFGKEVANRLVGKDVVVVLTERVSAVAKLRNVPLRHANSA